LTSNVAICEQNSENEVLLGALVYTNHVMPDHDFVRRYNLNINVSDAPHNTTIHQSKYIKDAWLSFLTIMSSVWHNGSLLSRPEISTLCEYDYRIQLPPDYEAIAWPETDEGDCKRTYELTHQSQILRILANENQVGEGKYAQIIVPEDANITAELELQAKVKIDHWHWYTWCCQKSGECERWCHECRFHHTQNDPDNVEINETKEVELFTTSPFADLKITNKYYNISRGRYFARNYSFFRLNFNNSFIEEQKYYYDVVFDKKPYYFITLKAHAYNSSRQRNIIAYNNSFVIKNTVNCSLTAYNHFYNFSSDCDLTLHEESIDELSIEESNADLSFLIFVIIFVLIVYVLYRLARSQLGKIAFIFLVLFLVLPFVHAEAQEDDEECGLTNLAVCLPAKMYDYLLFLLNAPILPLLEAVKRLLTTEVSIDIFQHLWSIIRYILSFFYIFLFMYSGYTFLTSSSNPVKRSQAKDSLRDAFLMIVLIQGSYYIYGILLSVSSMLNNAVLGMIDPHFFMITADNIINIGLEGLLVFTYVTMLFITLLLLCLRYIFVAFGVVLFPLGLFCYFIPPLKSYGRLILNILGVFLFITFINLLIILACSLLIQEQLFENLKIVVMIVCFMIVNYTLILSIKFALTKSANSSIKDDLSQTVKYLARVI